MVRVKNRYYLCEIINAKDSRTVLPTNITEYHIRTKIKEVIQEQHGLYGLAVLQIALKVKYLNRLTNIVMIRVGRTYHKVLGSSLPFINRLGNQEVLFRTLHLGGTIRSCQKFLINYHRRQLPILLKECETEDEREKVKKSIQETSSVLTNMGFSDWKSKRRSTVGTPSSSTNV